MVAYLGLALSVKQAGIVALPPLFGLLVDGFGGYGPAWVILAGLLLAAAFAVTVSGRLGRRAVATEPPR